MNEASARNLRTVERFLLVPPLTADFASSSVSICDISARGARFKHDKPLENGRKGVLKVSMDGQLKPLALEAVIVWTEPDGAVPGRFVSGVRTYGSPQIVNALIAQLKTSRRSNRIEELRSSDRFFIAPALSVTMGGTTVRLENLSARGARIEASEESARGSKVTLSLRVPDSKFEVSVPAEVRWTAMKAISGADKRTWRAGLLISSKPEQIRLAIAQLCEANRASLDTQSLSLKLKIMKARARQFAPSYKSIEAAGIPAEQYLLIQGVREELRANPDEAMHWYRRARLMIADPATRSVAPIIADHPDALAVWEYLERTVDPTVVGRAFDLPRS